MSGQNKITQTWKNHAGRDCKFNRVKGNLARPETVGMVKSNISNRIVDPFYVLFDYGNTETNLTNEERSKILDDIISKGVTKFRLVFDIDQPYYEPMKLSYRWLMKTKDIDADIEVFRNLEDAEKFLFYMLEHETMEQREL